MKYLIKIFVFALIFLAQLPQAAFAQSSNVNVRAWGGGTLGAISNYGTSPGAVLVPGMNAFVTNTVTVNGSGVTQPVSVASGQIVDGGNATEGAKADAACAGGGSSCSINARLAHLENLSAGAIPAGTNVIGYISNDPCAEKVKTTYPVLITGTTTVKIVSLASSQQIYICSVALIASGATVMSIVDGTKNTTECDTAAHAIFGQTTATHGMSLAANGGFTIGNGAGTVGGTVTTAHDLCIFQSGAGDISGNITVVQQ